MANSRPERLSSRRRGTSISALDISSESTFNTDTVRIKGDWIGLYQYATVSGGTSPTVDVTLQVSFDGGTTWISASEDKNSATQISLTQLTATGGEEQFFINPHPNDSNILYRATVTIGGTLSTFDLTLKFFTRNTATEDR